MQPSGQEGADEMPRPPRPEEIPEAQRRARTFLDKLVESPDALRFLGTLGAHMAGGQNFGQAGIAAQNQLADTTQLRLRAQQEQERAALEGRRVDISQQQADTAATTSAEQLRQGRSGQQIQREQLEAQIEHNKAQRRLQQAQIDATLTAAGMTQNKALLDLATEQATAAFEADPTRPYGAHYYEALKRVFPQAAAALLARDPSAGDTTPPPSPPPPGGPAALPGVSGAIPDLGTGRGAAAPPPPAVDSPKVEQQSRETAEARSLLNRLELLNRRAVRMPSESLQSSLDAITGPLQKLYPNLNPQEQAQAERLTAIMRARIAGR